MGFIYGIKVKLITSAEKEISDHEAINYCQELFGKSIWNIIEGTGTLPSIGDLITPLNVMEDNPTYKSREVFGRKFNSNSRLIEYEIG